MRVIAGSAKGIRLDAPEGLSTRPTTDKTREAVFGSLQFMLGGAVCLDLFAGSGAMGIEALSRGAARCVFVDIDRKAIGIIKKNLAATRVSGAEVLQMHFEQALARMNERFDFIFLDPPYASGFYQKAVDLILERNLLSADGMIFAEHDGTLCLKGVKELKTKRYGKSYVSRFVKEDEDAVSLSREL